MRRRLDVEMVRRGMAGSRTEAAMAIRSGAVTVAGRPAAKASTLVDADESIQLAHPPRRFVSRGGDKLDAALSRFSIDVTGLQALDAGASTGGFTDCLLSRGAAHVVAVDVGYGQLDWRLRRDERVTVLERRNARDLQPEDLPYAPDMVTADLSFISLRLVIPALVRGASAHAEFVLLVKPQFEAGKDEVRSGGVVSDPASWRRVILGVVKWCLDEDIAVAGVMASPLLGPAGNAEFIVHGRRGGVGQQPLDLEPAIEAAIRDATSLGGAGDAERSRLLGEGAITADG